MWSILRTPIKTDRGIFGRLRSVADRSVHLYSSPFDPFSLSSLSVLLGCFVVYSPWCPTFFHFFFISFFHPLVALLRCTVGECRSGRQTDTGRVLWTTFPLTWLSFFLLLFLLSWSASLPPLISNLPKVHERILLMLYISLVHRLTL